MAFQRPARTTLLLLALIRKEKKKKKRVVQAVPVVQMGCFQRGYRDDGGECERRIIVPQTPNSCASRPTGMCH